MCAQDVQPTFGSGLKRLPIVFCLDVSPSMKWTIESETPPIQLLSKAIERFFVALKENPKAYAATEIAFVTFSSNIEMNTEFKPLRSVEIPEIDALEEGGTNISLAVLEAIKKIDERRAAMASRGIKYYAPFLVIVTDGDPDQIDRQSPTYAAALKAIEAHCHDHTPIQELILPFVIGIGSRVDTETLNAYARFFLDGYLPVRGSEISMGDRLAGIFNIIIQSALVSFTPNSTHKTVISETRSAANQWLAEIEELTKLNGM